MISAQIQRLLDAGAKCEQGVISAVKKDDYGFIKALDRAEELYFRLDDYYSKNEEEPIAIREGLEVEFFVMVESVRGKMSDRAVHVSALPKGTVKFEVTISAKVTGTVVQQNTFVQGEEEPGIVRLDMAIDLASATAAGDKAAEPKVTILKKPDAGVRITTVEIWQRCLPEDLVLKAGDRIQFDVQLYRPEKLYFARKVQILEFRKLGRETGSICALKDQGFGFIFSPGRNLDLYFRATQVIDSATGEFAAESKLAVDMAVTFDVVLESTSQGSKLRAQRVRLEAVDQKGRGVSLAKQTLFANAVGIVVRNVTKKEAGGLGMIRVLPEYWAEIKDLEYLDTDVVDGLTQFRDLSEIRQIVLYGMSNALIRVYGHILLKKFPNILFDSKLCDESDPSLGKMLKIYKAKDASEYSEWLQKDPLAVELSAKKEAPAVTGIVTNAASAAKMDEPVLSFHREDCRNNYGATSNDLKVSFDVVWDKQRSRRVAKFVRLTDEAVEESEGGVVARQGVIDVVISHEQNRNECFGFIRCVPSDEKLLWHSNEIKELVDFNSDSGETVASVVSNGIVNGKSVTSIVSAGNRVQFVIRKRGGLRNATNIKLLNTPPPGREVLGQLCQGILVNDHQVLPIDVSACPLLKAKYVSLQAMQHVIAETEKKSSRDSSKSSAVEPIWTKGASISSTVDSSTNSPAPPSGAASLNAATPDAAEVLKPPAMFAGPDSAQLKVISPSPLPPMPPAPAESPVPVDLAEELTKADTADSGTAATGGESAVVADYKARYFPAIPRSVVDVIAPEAGPAPAFKVGTVMQGNAVANWFMQRGPIGLTNLSKASVDGAALCRRGRITRLKFKLHLAGVVESETVTAADLQMLRNLEFCEITVEDSYSAMIAGIRATSFFCVANEIVQLPSAGSGTPVEMLTGAGSSRKVDPLALGDEVEYWTLPQFENLALHPVVVPKVSKEIQFSTRKVNINAELKDAKTKSGIVSTSSMAKGPPEDSAKGFEKGWRDVKALNVGSLPWKHLLTHLDP